MLVSHARRLFPAIAVTLATSASAWAQVPAEPPLPSGVVIDGPPPPVAPESMSRDRATGKATASAIKLEDRPFLADGVLDEAVYREHRPFGGLLQVVPRHGQESTEKTDIWVLFDETTIYVSARCYDSAPPDQWIANELRRDTNQTRQNDHFAVGFDTFYDRRSGFMFYANPLGGFADYSVVDEGAPNSDWNPVWDVRTGRFDGGWTIEMAIPFKSLRYLSGDNQVWGIQFRRSIRRKNEWAYWTPLPQNLGGPQGLNRVSLFGTIVGLDLPAASKNVELKPYTLSRLTTDQVRVLPVSNDGEAEFGGDFKYGVTANLTADVIVNTDFAQVRFSPRPVKRFTAVRRFSYEASLEYFENGVGQVESRQQTGHFSAEFDNSDRLTVEGNASYDLLLVPFSPSPGVVIPIGGYHYTDGFVSYNMGQQRRVSGIATLQFGRYYSGTIRAMSFSNGRISLLKRYRWSCASRSTTWSCRRGPSRPSYIASAPTTAFRRGCSPAPCCSTTRPTTPSAATFGSAGNTDPEASSS